MMVTRQGGGGARTPAGGSCARGPQPRAGTSPANAARSPRPAAGEAPGGAQLGPPAASPAPAEVLPGPAGGGTRGGKRHVLRGWVRPSPGAAQAPLSRPERGRGEGRAEQRTPELSGPRFSVLGSRFLGAGRGHRAGGQGGLPDASGAVPSVPRESGEGAPCRRDSGRPAGQLGGGACRRRRG